jgi:serine/threonine protein kinase
MGEVYQATDPKLEQPVALKFLPEARAADPAARARLSNELRIARQVTHPTLPAGPMGCGQGHRSAGGDQPQEAWP